MLDLNDVRGSAVLHVGVALTIGVLMGGVLAGAPSDALITLLVALAVAAAALFTITSRLAQHERAVVTNVFLLALALRLCGVFLLHYLVSDPTLFAGDDIAYEHEGMLLARSWEHGYAHRLPELGTRTVYGYWNAALFYVFGPIRVLPKAMNAVIGACVVFPVYHLAQTLHGQRAARIASLIVAVLPSLVLWSSLNIRDPFAILAVLVAVDAAVSLRRRVTAARIVLLLSALLALGLMRPYIVTVMGLGLAMSLAVVRSRHLARDFAAGMLVVLGFVIVIQYLGIGRAFVTEASLERLNELRSGLAGGASAFERGVDISTPLGAVAHFPIGFAYLLFAPFPWQITTLRKAFSLPEVLTFYAIFPFIIMGVRTALREKAPAALPVLAVCLAVLSAYALVEGNVGTAYRHKAQVVGLLAVFAGGGIAGWLSRRKRRRVAVFRFDGAPPSESRGLAADQSRG